MYAQDAGDEEIFELSPFTVEASEDEGYRATSSLAGSRIRTDLKDIGAAISVVTKDFMDDLGANDLNDILLYTTGTEAAGLGGNFSGASVNGGSRPNSDGVVNNPGSAYRVRGLGAPDRTRGYFLTSIPFDSYNSGRVDISRGANSILFGLGSPAGVINSGINSANTNKDQGEVRFRIASGSEDHLSYRGEFDYNKVLVDDKLGLRISGVEDQKKFQQDPAFNDSSRLYAALVAKPWKGGTFSINHERGDIDSNNPDPVSPTENVTSYLNGLKDYHAAIDEFGLNPNVALPEGWDPDNLPFYHDPFARGIKANSLYRLPNQVISADAGYANPFHTRGTNIFRNVVIAYDGPNSVFPDNAFIGQVRNKEATDAAAYAENGGAPDGYVVPKDKIATADLKGVQNIGYTDSNYLFPTVTDLSLFDFTKHLLAGTAGSQYKKFDATKASLSQTFLNGQVGFEVAFYDEHYEATNSNPFRSTKSAITVDIQKTLPIGGENPNFGRVYAIDRMNINNQTTDRNSTRFTAFASYDFEEKMFADNLLGKILGEHTVTGLYAEDETDSLNYSVSENWISEDPDVQEVLNSVMGVKPFQRQVAYLTYLGDGANLLSDPGSLSIADFAVNPNAIQNQRIPDTGGTQIVQMYNKGVLENYELVRAPYIRAGTLSNVVVDSKAVILQSRWLDDAILTTYGLRKDTRTEYKNTPPPYDPNDPYNTNTAVGLGNATIDPEYFNLDRYYGDPNAPYPIGIPIGAEVQEADTTSLSVVARLPQAWRQGILGDNDISLFYSKSENTSAGAARLDPRSNPIDQPSGETEEFGINASLFQGKLNVRVNMFESSIINASGRGRVGSIIGDAALKSIQTALDSYVENADNRNDLEEDVDSPNVGELLYPNYDEVPQFVDTIASLFGASIDLDNNTITLDESHPFANTWKASQAQLTVDPNTNELSGSGWFHRTPPNLADTQDVVSKGLEAEIVFNPTKNWRMLLNVARAETETANSLPHTKELLDLWEPILFGTRAASGNVWEHDLSYVGGLRRATPEPTPDLVENPELFWQLTANTFDKQVTEYNLKKALDGQRNPEEREWRANFITNYTFREGILNGFSVGGSLRWQDEVAIGYPLLTQEGGTVPDVENPYMGPDEINVGLRFGYTKKLKNNMRWNVSLNLNNITSDQDELIPVGAQPDGTIGVVRTAAPRTFSFQNSLRF